ncbi:Bromodomain adjacent to zinc finger domain protein 1A [Chlorella vulgaris]
MPLLNRRPCQFNAVQTVGDLPSDQEASWSPPHSRRRPRSQPQVWVVKSTGEVCRTYEAYLQKMSLYDQPVWSCKYTSKGGMTLDEAQASEHKALGALKSFPKDLEQQVCAAVHHSLLRIDELVNSISDSLKPPAAQDAETVAAGSGKQADAVVQETQQDSPSHFASKENENDQRQQTAAVDATAGALVEKPAAAGLASGGPADGLPPSDGAEAAAAPCPAPAMEGEPATAQKAEGGAAAAGDGGKTSKKPKTPKAPVSKAALRTFIIEHAEQQGPEHATKQVWVVRPELRERHNLPHELPGDTGQGGGISQGAQEEAGVTASLVCAAPVLADAPKGLGTMLPAKKDKKEAAATSTLPSASPGGSEAAAGGGSTQAKAPEETQPMVRVQAKSLEVSELAGLAFIIHWRPDQHAIMSASMLGYGPLDKLTHDQHLALLRYLCDLALDSDKMRSVLQRREDEAIDVKRDVREELAEQRKQLKDILDAEKEERKRKREEMAAAEEAAAAAAVAAAAAAAGEGSGAVPMQQNAQKQAGKQSVGPEEPSFELPERLREFTGASNDKKALAEKRRLDKEQNKWMGKQLGRQRVVEAAEKAAVGAQLLTAGHREAEKAKQREKEENEEAIYRAQEELEEKLGNACSSCQMRQEWQEAEVSCDTSPGHQPR